MAMKIALKGKNKMGFIDGTCVKPATSVVLSQQWERCNVIVLGWILGSLSQDLYAGQVYSDIASELWNELQETYDKMDGSVVFNLMHKINNLRQRDLSVPDYYHKLNSLWREFDILTVLPACVCENRPACTCCAKSGSANHTQLIRLMRFLMGLNDVYQPIRSTILAKDPLPNVKDAFYVVSREESRRGLYPGSSSSSKIQFQHVPFMLDIIMPTILIGGSMTGNNNNKKFNANSEVNHSVPSTSGSISSSFTNEQMVKLLSFINEKPTPAANMSGIKSSLSNNNGTWDGLLLFFMGANQHMTDSTKNMFNVVDVSSLMLTVGHPNGTLVMIFAIGSLRLTSGIVLFDDLVVPEYNDLNLGKLVGTGSVNGGLYLFDLDKIDLVILLTKFCLFWVKKLGFSKINHQSPCDICHKAKQTREPFPLSDHKSKSVGEIVHCDVWGPYRVVSKDGFKFFLTIVDDYSRAVWVYLLKSKTEVGEYIESFIKLVFTQFGKKVKIVRSDNGTEFVNHHLSNLFKDLGIIHQTSCAYTPQQNGVAERKHRHLLNVARSYPPQSCLLMLKFARDETHYRSNVTYEGLINTKGYAARFNDFVVNSSVRYGLEKYVCYNKLSTRKMCFSTTLNKTTKPKTFQEAAQNPKWIEAMNLEMEALFRNNTYVLVDLPPERKAIGLPGNGMRNLPQLLLNMALCKAELSYDGLALSESANDTPFHSHFYCCLLRVPKISKGAPVFVLVLYLVSWKSKKKQPFLGLLLNLSIDLRLVELFGVVRILKIRVVGLLPVNLYCDSSSAISIAGNLVFHEKTKHFEIDLHLVRDKVADGVVKVLKGLSASNVVIVFH
ncbi:putative RNA-directed DNA polymerase [Tanacetum coccineum]